MATIRAYSGDNRIATAVYRHNSLLQVYPEKKEFDSEEVWKQQHEADRYEILQQVKSSKPKKKSVATQRRDKEVMQFFEPDYNWLLKELVVERDENSLPLIRAKLVNGEGWTIFRSENFFEPPTLTKNGEPFTLYDREFSPAFTSITWLIMVCLHSLA